MELRYAILDVWKRKSCIGYQTILCTGGVQVGYLTTKSKLFQLIRS